MGRSVVFPADERGLNPTEITIAEILKQGGYKTGCFGKWHLGDQLPFAPLAQASIRAFPIPMTCGLWVTPKELPAPAVDHRKPARCSYPHASSQAVITDSITDAAATSSNGTRRNPSSAMFRTPRYTPPLW